MRQKDYPPILEPRAVVVPVRATLGRRRRYHEQRNTELRHDYTTESSGNVRDAWEEYVGDYCE